MSGKMKDLRTVGWTNPHAAMLFSRSGKLENGRYSGFTDSLNIDSEFSDFYELAGELSNDSSTWEKFVHAFSYVSSGLGEAAELDANFGRLHYHITITGLGDHVLVHFNDHTKAVTENRRLRKRVGVDSELIHDIKNLLQGLGSFDKVPKYIDVKNEAAKRAMDSVINMKNTVLGTCNAWIRMARAQDGAELHREYLYFGADVVEPVIPLIQDKITRKKATVSREAMYKSGDTLIYADRGRMGVVAFNLLTNALDYAQDGLTIACGHEPLVEGGRDVGKRLVFWNTKSYIKPEDRERIFTKFYTTGGTGLGLDIVGGIVEEHSGRISVDSGYDPSLREDYTSFRIDLYDEDVLRERGLLETRHKLYNPRE